MKANVAGSGVVETEEAFTAISVRNKVDGSCRPVNSKVVDAVGAERPVTVYVCHVLAVAFVMVSTTTPFQYAWISVVVPGAPGS